MQVSHFALLNCIGIVGTRNKVQMFDIRVESEFFGQVHPTLKTLNSKKDNTAFDSRTECEKVRCHKVASTVSRKKVKFQESVQGANVQANVQGADLPRVNPCHVQTAFSVYNWQEEEVHAIKDK